MAKRSTIRASLATTQRSGAPVTTASWLVWAVTASIITPIALLTRAVEPQPTWWSVLALGIGAAMATSSGHHAGRWLETHDAGRPNVGEVDPRTVREATGLAAIATGMVWDRTWNQVEPS